MDKDDLSVGKSAIQRPLWTCSTPEHCRRYEAANAVDRNFDTCMRTDGVGSSSTYRHVQWQVDLGGIRSIYNIRILFKSYGVETEFRQRGRFAGFALYLSNTTNKDDGYLCYKDGPELPPLDFNTKCIKHGRYLTYYNERVYDQLYPVGYASMVVTELCEVMIYGKQMI
ncbi:uncharacterized protein LOC134247457 [Saccostrea cucullata]|uniref:uncharacterized protein LOC134247457 n=1 Tax=Saccostrea cuccullata TaxID=36930 RepID=UPI002ED1AE28